MPEALKEMFNRQSVGDLAAAVQGEFAGFDCGGFMELVFDAGWPDLALKQRMRQIALALHEFLPGDYVASLDILRGALPALREQSFEKMVFPDYVEVFGLDDWQESMPALEFFTQSVSAEFAIRPFIRRYPGRTMAQMLAWAEHDHPRVRRLASEGCRPRLPWGMGLPAQKEDPAPILPILERLKSDPDESVRRSVANNLNDISKDHPVLVLRVLERWHRDNSPEMSRLVQHALRTMIKQGDPGALELLGYPSKPQVAVRGARLEPVEIAIGDSITLSFTVESTADVEQRLMIDYVLHLVRARGQRTAKVFKLTKKSIGPGQTIFVTKRQSFRPVSSRRYYPGSHVIQVQINGKRFEQIPFELLAENELE